MGILRVETGQIVPNGPRYEMNKVWRKAIGVLLP